jgi:Tol biopolymer transport system component
MATGKKPFEGETWVNTVDAVLNRAPRPAREWNPGLAPEIARAIERALEKDPAQRYQSAADMHAEVFPLKRAIESQHAPVALRASLPLQRYAATVIPALLAVGGLAWYLHSPRGPVAVPSEFVQLTNFNDYATAPAVSPDGKMVAFFRGGGIFLNTGQVYVKILPDGESKQLTNDSHPKYDPVFTPDGSRVAYTVQYLASHTWDTFTVPVLGGTPTRLIPNAAGLSWFGPDHRIVFSEVMAGTALHMGIVTSQESRAEEHEVYFPPHERAMAHYSWPSPDQRSVLIVEMDRTQVFQRCRVVPIQGGSTGVQVGPQGSCIAAQWSPDGKWMYFNVEIDGATHLWRQRAPDGVPEQITFGPTEEEGLALEPGGKSLITSIGARRSSVGIHDSSGDHTVSVEGSVFAPRLSLDAKRLYYLARKSNSPDTIELWSRDLATGRSDPVVTGQHITDYAISPDQTHVEFAVSTGGMSQIFLYALDRSSSPRPVTKDGDRAYFLGKDALVFRQLGDKANYVARIQTDGSGLARILDIPVAGTTGVSPDGEWAVASGTFDPSLPPGTFAVSLRDGSHRRLCAAACLVQWSPDGKFLYVTTSSALTSSGRTLVVPVPRGLGLAPLPKGGFDGEEVPGLQVIRQRDMSPGPDPDTYAFTTAEFQGNLFRIPLH